MTGDLVAAAAAGRTLTGDHQRISKEFLESRTSPNVRANSVFRRYFFLKDITRKTNNNIESKYKRVWANLSKCVVLCCELLLSEYGGPIFWLGRTCVGLVGVDHGWVFCVGVVSECHEWVSFVGAVREGHI